MLLSFSPAQALARAPWFLPHTLRIARPLAAARGLVGSSPAEPLVKRFWTRSVWEDDAALRPLVGTPPHARAMSVMDSPMGPTTFVRRTRQGRAAPPTRAAALGRAGGSRPTAG
jgi:hypothetical protein